MTKSKDFKEALYYMVTKEPVPKEDIERIEKSANIIGLGGLGALIAGVVISCAISIGPKKAYQAFSEGTYAGAVAPYASNLDINYEK